MHRFFLSDCTLEPNSQVDISSIAHQLRSVLRMKSGDSLMLLDNSGWQYPAVITHLARSRALAHTADREWVDTEPKVSLILFQCLLKGDRFEWVLQKGTELGVQRFVPVISSRTVVRLGGTVRRKYERWQGIIREAAEQSGRGRLPDLAEPMTWQEAIKARTGVGLLPWEEVRTDATGIRPRLEQADLGHGISLLIGPEGGISRGEAEAARQHGWQMVSLGPRILRAETAAIAALTILLHEAGELAQG